MENPETGLRPTALGRMSPDYWADVALGLLMFSILIYSCTRTLVDPDLYWHLKCGMDICHTGVVVAKDTYSFLTGDQRWFNHEWLAEVFFAYIYFHWGWVALVLFKAALVALMLGIIYKFISQWQFDLFGKSLVTLQVAFFASPATNCIRPHVFSCLLLAILFILLRMAENGRRKLLWLLPPMFVAWVNLHGAFFAGLATILLWIFLEWFVSKRYRQSPDQKGSIAFYWLIFVLCCLATFLTPYGRDFPIFMLSAAATPYTDVSEWQPIPLVSPLGALWAAMLFATIISLSLSKKPKDPTNTILWLIYAVAPLVAIRHLQFFGMATAIFVGEHLASAWSQRKSQSTVDPNRKWVAPDAIFCVISLLLSVWLASASFAQIPALKLVPDEDVPEKAVAILKRINAQGNLAVNFDWGGYAIWYLAPAVKVSYDGRLTFAYSPAARMANQIFNSGFGPWDTLLKQFPIDMVLVRTTSPALNLMKLLPNWKLVYQDEQSALFLPVGSKQLKRSEELLHSLPSGSKTESLNLPLL